MKITIPTTDFTVSAQGSPDRITTIHYRATEEIDGDVVASTYGTIGADLPHATTTEADAIAAVNSAVPDLQDRLNSKIARLAMPLLGTGLPWENQFAVWLAGVAYAVGDRVNFQGAAYEVIQAHTSQANWTPPAVPALFERIQDTTIPGDIPWVAGEAVAVSDIREFEGTRYVVIQAHTTQVGWEPPNVPALWAITD